MATAAFGRKALSKIATAIKQMTADIAFEAAFLRAALLVGLVHERELPEWAALLAALSLDGARDSQSAAILLRMLKGLQQEFTLEKTIVRSIQDFSERSMLASAGFSGVVEPTVDELHQWLDNVRPSMYFVFRFDSADGAPAFIAATARKFFRDRRFSEENSRTVGRIWVPGKSRIHEVVLNERAWKTVIREFSPVPLASRIPYANFAEDAIEVLDEFGTREIGVDDCNRILVKMNSR